MFRIFGIGLIAASLVLAAPEMAVAKDKGKPDHAKGGKGNNAAVKNPGKGPKAVPPGQIKRYTRGAKLPTDVNWDDIGDLSDWKLPPPGKGNKYIKLDNEVLKVAEDTQVVLDAMGIVGDLLK
ncbi:hypothetical protein R3X27_08305 [Tropicimonas sp. TH_r6]|uniref:hypothetical protein n=1 Tax=Tropicimonas sp. TH_r6 TaxID=3082085 RepID=UPI002954A57D|nr:hypothetical protein [Tropicimonas sp. TH_r6]MDV7142682.1 hypothetical protein [Tropicimonas sp. TH_r6]